MIYWQPKKVFMEISLVWKCICVLLVHGGEMGIQFIAKHPWKYECDKYVNETNKHQQSFGICRWHGKKIKFEIAHKS